MAGQATFDPNAPAQPGSGIFGLPYAEDEALVVLLPVPWEATTSYGGGTAHGPEAILEASKQVDLYDLDVEKPYQAGVHMRPIAEDVLAKSDAAKALAKPVIEAGGAGDRADLQAKLAQVNEMSAELDQWVFAQSKRILDAGKILGVVGGDHSVPFGAMKAAAERSKKGIGVLHFDAHSDTRDAYEGFARSHASIMFNVLNEIPGVKRLVQVGIRDVCEEEIAFCKEQGERVRMFSDRDLALAKHAGDPFVKSAKAIADALPDEVWVSFDIDGLDPRFCPHTGTPVPGGLDVQEVITILREVAKSRRIVGFDLNEVAPNLEDEGDEWDGNVGARMLYKLIGFTLASQGRTKLL
jgi:agmatinase